MLLASGDQSRLARRRILGRANSLDLAIELALRRLQAPGGLDEHGGGPAPHTLIGEDDAEVETCFAVFGIPCARFLELRESPRANPGTESRGDLPGPPDFAVEVRSPGDSRPLVAAKAKDWLDHGCRMVVTVDPKARTAKVYRPNAEPEEIAANGTISAGDVVPGFELRLEDLFAQ